VYCNRDYPNIIAFFLQFKRESKFYAFDAEKSDLFKYVSTIFDSESWEKTIPLSIPQERTRIAKTGKDKVHTRCLYKCLREHMADHIVTKCILTTLSLLCGHGVVHEQVAAFETVGFSPRILKTGTDGSDSVRSAPLRVWAPILDAQRRRITRGKHPNKRDVCSRTKKIEFFSGKPFFVC